MKLQIFKGLLLLALLGNNDCRGSDSAVTIFRGMCDASAVVQLDQNLFVVADDEDNYLRVYSRSRGGAPLQTLDLSPFLGVDVWSPEVDVEAAAPFNDRVYWISSHSQNKNGKDRVSRRRFFATSLSVSNGVAKLNPVGTPCSRLLTDLLDDPRMKAFDLTAAALRAPTMPNALNIEALCATPEGQLLIGFRNPIPNGRALIVPLINPDAVLAGEPAQFGDPLLLQLGGLGVRDLARVGNRYFLIAGRFDSHGDCQLYEWNGKDQPRHVPRRELAGLNPEGLSALLVDGSAQLLVVSDDGTLEVGGEECKTVADPSLKYFRTTTIDLR